MKHGLTEGCPGCQCLAEGKRAQGHSEGCRARLEAEIAKTEEGIAFDVVWRQHVVKLVNSRNDPAKFKNIGWDRSIALILRGPAETGKTSWAIHQFKNLFKDRGLGRAEGFSPRLRWHHIRRDDLRQVL